VKPSTILSRAADLIETRDLHKGDYIPRAAAIDLDTCPLDVVAAISVATGRGPGDELTHAALAAACALSDHLALDPDASLIDGLGAWSDRAEQTARTVAATCRELAAELTARGQ